MFHKRLTGRLVPFGVCVAVITLTAATARSERLGDERACMGAFKKARDREESGKLQQAKDLLMSCAQAPCGGFMRQQCANKYNQLESDTPSVVLIVTDPSGAPRADVQVRLDGEIFARQLDGRALTVDPGMHEFSFVADGVVFGSQKVMIVQGQRNRFITAMVPGGGKHHHLVAEVPAEKEAPTPAAVITPSNKARTKLALREETDKEKESTEATLAPAAAPLAEMPADPIDGDTTGKKSGSILPWIVGGLGVASLGAAGVMTYWGRKDNDALRQCTPNCDPASTQHIKRLYLGSDIAAGVGLAALGVATWLYITHHSSNASNEERASEQALRVDLAPTHSGGFASVSGSF
jgi:hypothetical protein